MSEKPRFYDNLLREHLRQNRQMALVSGPRQVGKTTTCRGLSDYYSTWDKPEDRRIILAGPDTLAQHLDLVRPRTPLPVATLDELHKYAKWKNFLKGFFDVYADRVKTIITGSSRLDIFRRGSDSLMGRYFIYRMHPWSVAEIGATNIPSDDIIRPQQNIPDQDWEALLLHGGFPEPFLKRDVRFTRRWSASRHDQLLKEDLREITRIQELGVIEVLAQLLAEGTSQQLVYNNYAKQLGVTIQTVKRWVDILVRLHFGFTVSPWFQSLQRAIRKEPKWFLRDWSGVTNEGARAETFMACHLLKAVDGWTDLGLGEFQLRYIRTQQGEEVDFLVVRDRKPWMLVESKCNAGSLSPHLIKFQNELKAKYAFQVAMNLPFENINCFSYTKPVIVPARTFLSQLL
jgi:uncharacterized protein